MTSTRFNFVTSLAFIYNTYNIQCNKTFIVALPVGDEVLLLTGIPCFPCVETNLWTTAASCVQKLPFPIRKLKIVKFALLKMFCIILQLIRDFFFYKIYFL